MNDETVRSRCDDSGKTENVVQAPCRLTVNRQREYGGKTVETGAIAKRQGRRADTVRSGQTSGKAAGEYGKTVADIGKAVSPLGLQGEGI